MQTPSIAFRHLCRKPELGVCEPCSHRDEQVGPALFVQGTQHCALLTPISGLCSVWVSVTHSPSPSTKATQRGGGGGGGGREGSGDGGGGGGGSACHTRVSKRQIRQYYLAHAKTKNV